MSSKLVTMREAVARFVPDGAAVAMGLALAWNLAAAGAQKILVLERGYRCEGEQHVD